jgi:hypothetical protein
MGKSGINWKILVYCIIHTMSHKISSLYVKKFVDFTIYILTKYQDQYYRFTDYKLSTTWSYIIFVFLALNNYGITAI